MAKQYMQYVWDGQKSIDLDHFPPQAWEQLSGQSSTGNDSRAELRGEQVLLVREIQRQ